MPKTRYSKVWNLDKLFLDGSNSSQLHNHIKQLEFKVSELEEIINTYQNLSDVSESPRVESVMKFKTKGRGFEEEYIELLRDSGSMSTEDLVMKHLKEDITSVDFWENGVKLCVKDVDDFINLIAY